MGSGGSDWGESHHAMKVAIISAVYPPEPVVSARMSFDLARALVKGGHKVVVLCPQPSRPMGADYGAYRRRNHTMITFEDGVEVVRLPSFCFPASGLMGRIRESWSFGQWSCAELARRPLPDVLYLNGWPLFAQGRVAWFARRRRIRLVLHIKDLYPESWLTKIPAAWRTVAAFPLMIVDRWIARQATRVVAISETVRHAYVTARKVKKENVITVPDWSDASAFEVLPSRLDACRRYEVPAEKFTYLYLGNIGPVAGVDRIIEAFCAARLKCAQLLIIGDGSAKSDCIAVAAKLGTNDVRFISDPDVSHVPELQSLAHVCLLPVRRGLAMSSIPSKLMAYLFSAKPILATLDSASDTAKMIREAGCGWLGPPDDVVWLAGKMGEIASVPLAELEMMGMRGRRYALMNFSKDQGVSRLADIVSAGQRGEEWR